MGPHFLIRRDKRACLSLICTKGKDKEKVAIKFRRMALPRTQLALVP